MSDLRGLIERVEKATGPDREIDGDLHEMAYGEWLRKHGYVSQGETGYFSPTPPVQGAGHVRAPEHYTDSVDAALALVEKMRPGWRLSLGGSGDAWQALIHENIVPHKSADFGESGSQTRPLPLAIILALLRSLDSPEKPTELPALKAKPENHE